MKIIELTEYSDNNAKIRLQLKKLSNKTQLLKEAAIPARPPTSILNVSLETLKKLLKIEMFGAALKPIWDYFTDMSNTQAKLDAKQITPENYNELHVAKAGMLISNLAMNVGKILQYSLGTTLLANFISIIPVVGAPAAAIIRLLSAGQLAYVMTKLNTREGHEAIAGMIGVGLVKDIGRWAVPALEYFHQLIEDALKLDLDAVKKDLATEKPADTTTNAPAGDKLNLPTTSSNRLATPYKDPNAYSITPLGYTRDSNGQLQPNL